jgi:hypothetical protein
MPAFAAGTSWFKFEDGSGSCVWDLEWGIRILRFQEPSDWR